MIKALHDIRVNDNPIDCDFYGYVNGDILLDNRIEELLDVVHNAQLNHQIQSKVLLVGRRTNLFSTHFSKIQPMNSKDYLDYIQSAYKRLEQFMGLAMDYFIFTDDTFGDDFLSNIVVGRDMIDSYIFHYCYSKQDVSVVDCSKSCSVIR